MLLNSSSGEQVWEELSEEPGVVHKLRNCEGCKKRKEFIMRHGFWTGVVVGVVGVYAFHRFVKPIPGKNG